MQTTDFAARMSLSMQLKTLSATMDSIAKDLRRYSPTNAQELRGAASIARQWAKEVAKSHKPS